MTLDFKKELEKFVNKSKSRRLNWERFLEFQWFPSLMFGCFFALVLILSFLILDYMIKTMPTEDFLQIFVPIILFVQMFVLILQIINQRVGLKYTMINCIPILSLKVEGSKYTGEEDMVKISLKNSGHNADNIDYSIKINGKSKISNFSFFSLHNEKEKTIHKMDKNDFKRSKIDIKVKYEGLIGSNFGYAHFKKYPNDNDFMRVSKLL